jgi:hypothetical protein
MVESQVAGGLTYRKDFVAGWTGPVQVRKGVAEPTDYAELDEAYIDVWRGSGPLTSVGLDLSLLIRTLVVLAKGEGLNY